MDEYTIHKIALYVKDAEIVKQLFYIPKYRDLIYSSEYHFDELVLLYSKKNWMNTNDLTIIKSFYRLNIQCFIYYYKTYMDYAASNGHIEIVKWLHENRKEGCTTFAMDIAAQNGHLEMVKWLHENRKEGCSIFAMDSAADKGHLEIVKWLDENRKEGCTKLAMDWAACNGHLEVIKWLHQKRKEGFNTTDAMNYAVENGHIEVVKWLQDNIKIVKENIKENIKKVKKTEKIDEIFDING